VLNLHIGGGIIETTAEHPFWVRDRGWVEAYYLRLGDELATLDGRWVLCEGVAESGRVETVYNVEVAGGHTYFVGADGWGFAVWAHNAKKCAESTQRTSKIVHDEFTKKVLGKNAKEKTVPTPWSTGKNGEGSRRYDGFDPKTGTAFEGNTTPWSQMTDEQLSRKLKQAGDDFAILKTSDEVKKVIWFATEELPSTGLGRTLKDALKSCGISFFTVKT
jgi:intein/homing endonuclease